MVSREGISGEKKLAVGDSSVTLLSFHEGSTSRGVEGWILRRVRGGGGWG